MSRKVLTVFSPCRPMSRKQKPFAVIDCETDPFDGSTIPEPFIWGYYDEEIYREFSDSDTLARFLMQCDKTVYAHNGGKFDFHFLLQYANLYESITVIAGRVAQFRIGEAQLRDSYCILPTPLSEFNKQEFDYKKLHFSVRHLHMPEIRKYLFSDCENLYNYVKAFRDEYGKKLTLAGTAMKQYEKIEETKADNTTERFFNNFSRFYAGGRVQCFQSGIIKGDITIADINSAYPRAMMEEHPKGSECEISAEEPEKPEGAFIKLRARATGAFHIRDKDGLHFPNDGEIREFHTTGWEYFSAKRLGLLHDAHIIECRTFLRTQNFKKYVGKFFEMKAQAKETGDKPRYIFSKILQNALYGKFASNPEKYKEYLITDPASRESFEEEGYLWARDIGCNHLMERPIRDEAKRYYNVATAASITGYVRAYLLEAIHSVENVLYCDTDSIFFTGKHELPVGKELGAWDIEAKCDSVAIAGKKLYSARRIDGTFKTAAKGGKISPEEIYKVSKGDKITFNPESPIFSLKSGIYFSSKIMQKTA